MKVTRTISEFGDIIYRNYFGELHREDGPAIINPNGECWWFKNDMAHRLDGPAMMRPFNGVLRLVWYVNDCHGGYENIGDKDFDLDS